MPRGQGHGTDQLRHAFSHAANAGFINLLSRAPKSIARLCERALANDIDPDFVRRVIVTQQLEPPEGAGPAWPWPVRIRTLGGFEVEIRDKRYTPAHKTQDKPLELLKLLLTAQALGRDSIDKHWAGERLWPDADTANSRKSLDMTISRLRRLLDDDAALQTPEGRLRLSPLHVWTDIAPLMRALSHIGVRRDEHATGRSVPAAAALDIANFLELYRGPFLPEEDPPPWLIAGREAVAAAVRAALLTAETVLQGQEDVRLVPAIERAFAADATSEDLARALMRALLRRGRHGEALIVYRRVREMLSVVLGVTPARGNRALEGTSLYSSVSGPRCSFRRRGCARHNGPTTTLGRNSMPEPTDRTCAEIKTQMIKDWATKRTQILSVLASLDDLEETETLKTVKQTLADVIAVEPGGPGNIGQ